MILNTVSHRYSLFNAINAGLSEDSNFNLFPLTKKIQAIFPRF